MFPSLFFAIKTKGQVECIERWDTLFHAVLRLYTALFFTNAVGQLTEITYCS